MKEYDANGDGALDRSEFSELMQASPESGVRPTPNYFLQFPDENHDGKVDLVELDAFMKQQTRSSLRSRKIPGIMPFSQMKLDPNQPFDPRQMFKAVVESYWQHPSEDANHPLFINKQNPFGAGFIPKPAPQNEPQQTKPQSLQRN